MTPDGAPRTCLADRIAQRYAALAPVRAVALGGSWATGHASADSDLDLYVFVTAPLSDRERARVVSEDTDAATIRNDYWGPGDEWEDPTGTAVDVMFWHVGWIENELQRVLVRHEASLGYTTCFWHTIREARVLHDGEGWFAKLQELARSPYPEKLVRSIVAKNYPVLRNARSAYARQIEKARTRGDRVSVNHRVAAFLASYFDIVFALNRLPHPGEKRLLAHLEEGCPKRPAHVRDDVQELVGAVATQDDRLAHCVNALVDRLDPLLQAEGL